MLTENDIKEALSRAYIQAICCMGGYNYSTDAKDYGFDFTIKGILQRPSGKCCPSGLSLDIQLKATTDYEIDATHIKYQLRNKNYNDLAQNMEGGTKRILVVLLLPANKQEWLAQDIRSLIIKKCAYWLCLEGMPLKVNEDSATTIQIPTQNMFSVDNLNRIMTQIQARGDLNGL
ncbi:MAG: DUF4365 domain-containing protein [Candidatus Nanoarchaeia archaeon]|nr:DUF4365 domain-containing protein [Candidatus Nanoarchaeia archaeon]MDD5239164.1 DUF4365 domain-containing protein [Candidatus Nanoarchaeia archaeon]